MQPGMMDTTWSVVSQAETMEPGANNTIAKGVRVQFTTGLGQKGSVFVPQEVYVNLDRVRDMITQAATSMDAVSKLTS